MFLNLEAPIHRHQLMTWVHLPQLSTAFPLSLAWGPMNTALMSLSAQSTAWLLPQPSRAIAPQWDIQGLPSCSAQEKHPPTVSMSSYTKGTEFGSSVATA